MKKANEGFFSGRMEEKSFYMLLLLSAAVIAAAAYILFAQPQEQPETAGYQTEQSVTTSDEVTDVPKQPETAEESEPDTSQETEATVQESEARAETAETDAQTQQTDSAQTAEESEIQTIETMTFVKPTESGQVSHTFTKDLEYNETTEDWRTHNGTDYSGEAGDAVFAAADGIVTAVGTDPLWGEYIVLSHAQDITSKYCGIAEVELTEGDNVEGGTQIAVIGKSIPIEEKEGAHLHLEMQKNKQYLNAEEVFG